MKKAFIYFNGQFVASVGFEKIERTEINTYLTIGFGDSMKTVAIIPSSHLIIIE